MAEEQKAPEPKKPGKFKRLLKGVGEAVFEIIGNILYQGPR